MVKHTYKYQPHDQVIKVILPIMLAGLIPLSLIGCAQLATTGVTTVSETTNQTTSAAPSETTGTSPTRPAKSTFTLKLEGNDVIVPVTLYMSDLGYSMYYDDALYKIVQVDSQLDPASIALADQYLPIKTLDSLPNVYLEIGHVPDTTPDAALTMMMTLLSEKYVSVTQGSPVGIGVDKIDALVIEANNGDSQESEMASIAIISDGKSGIYYFMNAYYLVVAEGHKSRLNQLIDTFKTDT